MAAGELMHREMREQPDVLSRLLAQAPTLVDAVRAVAPAPLSGITFLARGSSDNAALLGRYLTELSAGRPAGMAAPSLYTRYGARVDHRGYLLVALSQSGATPEIVTTCAAMQQAGAVAVAVTNETDSALARTADLALCTDAGHERAVPATKTVTAQMLMMAVVAAGLGGQEGVPGAAGLPGAVATVLADDPASARLAQRWAGVGRLYVTGRGLLYPAALETALKIKETTGILAEGVSIADLLHGPISSVEYGIPVLVIGPDQHTGSDVEELAGRLAGSGADVATVSAAAGADLPLPGSPSVLQAAVTATVRGQQLAWHLARQRGLDPDHPRGLTKVTPTD